MATAERDERRQLLLLVVVGPAAWMAHLLASYGLIYVTCRPGARFLLHIVTLLAVGVILLLGVRQWRRDRSRADTDRGGWGLIRTLGWALTGFFLLVTVMAGVASLVVSPCL